MGASRLSRQRALLALCRVTSTSVIALPVDCVAPYALSLRRSDVLLQFDNGITGGVTSMPAFLEKFFPNVYHHTQDAGHGDSAYCKYNNQGLQLFTSCLFIAAAFSSLVGGYTTR